MWDHRTGRTQDALEGFTNAFTLYKKGGFVWGQLDARRVVSEIQTGLHRFGEAEMAVRTALALCPADALWLTGMCLRAKANLCNFTGKLDQIAELLIRSREKFQKLGLRWNVADCTMGLADNARLRKVPLKERAFIQDALANYKAMGDTSGLVKAASRLGRLDYDLGHRADGERRAQLLGESAELLALGRLHNEKVASRVLAEDMDRLELDLSRAGYVVKR